MRVDFGEFPCIPLQEFSERSLVGVPDTTYIPLVARIYVSKLFPDYFRDEQILGMVANLKRTFPAGELVFDATDTKGEPPYPTSIVSRTCGIMPSSTGCHFSAKPLRGGRSPPLPLPGK